MDSQQFSDMYIMTNCKLFPSDKIYLLKDKLSRIPEEKQILVQSVPLKNPLLTFILSWFLGMLGIDRFYLGDIVLGILKFLTLGGLGIWAFIDLFLTYGKAKKVNFNLLMQVI